MATECIIRFITSVFLEMLLFYVSSGWSIIKFSIADFIVSNEFNFDEARKLVNNVLCNKKDEILYNEIVFLLSLFLLYFNSFAIIFLCFSARKFS